MTVWQKNRQYLLHKLFGLNCFIESACNKLESSCLVHAFDKLITVINCTIYLLSDQSAIFSGPTVNYRVQGAGYSVLQGKGFNIQGTTGYRVQDTGYLRVQG